MVAVIEGKTKSLPKQSSFTCYFTFSKFSKKHQFVRISVIELLNINEIPACSVISVSLYI